MHIIVEREDLKDAVWSVSRAISSQVVIPILTGIKLEAANEGCVLTGSNAATTIQASVPVKRVFKQGSVVLPAKYFGEIVKRLPDRPIEMEVADNFVTKVRAEKTEFILNGLDAEEYPRIPQLQMGESFSVPAKALKELISHTSFAVAKSVTRPILNGVLVKAKDGCMTMIAADGHRLAHCSIRAAVDHEIDNVVIPGESLDELQRLLNDESDVDVVISRNQILFKNERLVLFTSLLEGTYPDTERIIPTSYKTRFQVDGYTFLSSLQRVSVLAEGKNRVAHLEAKEKSLELSASQNEVGKVFEEIPHSGFEGEEEGVSFNVKSVIEIINAVGDGDVEVWLGGRLHPIMIKKAEQDGVLYVIMPVRINY